MNFLNLMESGKMILLKDDDIFRSLKSIMIEHDSRNANIKIYGRYSHITEGLIRAAWANHSTRLELWARQEKNRMSFKDKYTTSELITKDTSPDKKEKDKTIISTDAYAIGELLDSIKYVMGVK